MLESEENAGLGNRSEDRLLGGGEGRVPQHIRPYRLHKLLIRHLPEQLVRTHDPRVREHDI